MRDDDGGISGLIAQFAWGVARELGLRVAPPRRLRRRQSRQDGWNRTAGCPDGACF